MALRKTSAPVTAESEIEKDSILQIGHRGAEDLEILPVAAPRIPKSTSGCWWMISAPMVAWMVSGLSAIS
jgi:hypothetical protein